MKLASLSFVVVTLVAGDPQVVDACSFAPNETHALDAAFANDATPPGAPDVTPTVRRWEYPSSCFDIGLIDVAVSATDNAAPPDRLGYRFSVRSGDPPDRFGITADAIAPPALDGSDSVSLFFNYMDTAFAFELEVRAVDLNGNVGPPTVVYISDPAGPNNSDDDDTGCSATGSSSSNGLASLLTLGVLFTLRSRRK
jgi:MYXO-CTERM domain-containing protein